MCRRFVHTVVVQIGKEEEDEGLPLRGKLLILLAPYRSLLSQKKFLKTIYSLVATYCRQ